MTLNRPGHHENGPDGDPDVRRQSRVIALFGGAGTGKGLIATRLAHYLASQGKTVQRLADWREPGGVLRSFNDAEIRLGTTGKPPDFVLLECSEPDDARRLLPTIANPVTLSVVLVINNTFSAVCIANEFCEILAQALAQTGVRGVIISTHGNTGEAAAFAAAASLPVLAQLPLDVGLTPQAAETILHNHPTVPRPLSPAELISIFEEGLATGDTDTAGDTRRPRRPAGARQLDS